VRGEGSPAVSFWQQASFWFSIIKQKGSGQMKALINSITLIGSFLLTPLLLLASSPENDDILFQIVRSRDAGKIYYQVNLDKEGNLIAGNPVEIFWLKQTQNNQKEPLTWIQNKYAYGLQFLEVDLQFAIFRFVSFTDKTFVLQKDDNGAFRVFTTCGDREMIVNSLFVHFENDSFWFPKIIRVELHATDISTRSPVVERLNP
jgi:hypothetical protein